MRLHQSVADQPRSVSSILHFHCNLFFFFWLKLKMTDLQSHFIHQECPVKTKRMLAALIYFFQPNYSSYVSYFILCLHTSVSSGKIHPPSTQTASLTLMALSLTSWRERRLWFSAWESAVASVKLLHEMKSTSSWPFSSRTCTFSLFLESHWT